MPEINSAAKADFYALQLKDKDELQTVSSGGAFQGFARAVIESNGVVYGAEQQEVDHISHVRIIDINDLYRIKRSKYLQSDTGICYSAVKKDLLNNKIVLFSGTGCQIAGLNCFLGQRYENLFTCEVVCHGVPSRRVWNCYRSEKEDQEGKKICDLVFRDKSRGWSNNQYKIVYEDGTAEYELSTKHLFHAGYLQGLFYRPSCGTCPFSSMPRTADITLADFWQYKGALKKGNSGVSLAAVNNMHGMEMLRKAEAYLDVEQVSEESALSSCRHMNAHPIANPQRNAFLQMVFSDGYYAAAEKYIKNERPTIKSRIKHKLKSFIGR